MLIRFIIEAPTIEPDHATDADGNSQTRFTSPDSAKTTAPATAIGKMLANEVAWAR